MQLDFKNLMYDIPGHNAIKVLTVPTSIYKFKKTPIKIQTGMGLGGVGIRGGLDKIFVSYIKKKKEIWKERAKLRIIAQTGIESINKNRIMWYK